MKRTSARVSIEKNFPSKSFTFKILYLYNNSKYTTRGLAMSKVLLAEITRGVMFSMMLFIAIFCRAAAQSPADPVWLNIFIHGTVAFQANFSYKTIMQAKNDCIEGTDYERNVLNVRENPYLFALQPMQKVGFHEVKEQESIVNASFIFTKLFQEVQRACGIQKKESFLPMVGPVLLVINVATLKLARS